MKKTLTLLAVSLLMCSIMVLGASAIIVEDDYVAWDFTNPEDAADWYPTNESKGVTLNTVDNRTTLSGSIKDIQVRTRYDTYGSVAWPNSFDFADYPLVVYRYRNFKIDDIACLASKSSVLYYRSDEATKAYNKQLTTIMEVTNDDIVRDIKFEPTNSYTGTPKYISLGPFVGMTNWDWENEPVERSVEIVSIGLYKTEAAYNQYLADVALSRLERQGPKTAADEDSAAAALNKFADSYEESYGVTLTFGEATYEEPINGNAGTYTVAVTATYGEKTATGEVALAIPFKVSFEMKGVQYRADGVPGLRFGIQVSYDDYVTGLNGANGVTDISGVTDVSFGTLLVPSSALTDGSSLDFENLTATAEENVYTLNNYSAVDVPAAKIFESNQDNFIYTAVITNIPAETDVELTARAYCKYTYGGNVYYCYGEPITRAASLQETDWN